MRADVGHGENGAGAGLRNVKVNLIPAVARVVITVRVTANVEVKPGPLHVIPVPHRALQVIIPSASGRERRGADIHISAATVPADVVSTARVPVGRVDKR